MTVPHHDPHKQLPNTAVPADVELMVADNDHEPVPGVNTGGTSVCPCCKRPWFDPAASMVLDLLVTAHKATQTAQAYISTLKATVERTVVP
jgi:hypothetical protein